MQDRTAMEEQPAARGLSLTGRPLPDYRDPVRAPLGPTPLRRARAVRRTMSIDVEWPDGIDQAGHYIGHCRDIRTDAGGATPVHLAQADVDVIAADRQIRSIAATPAPPHLQQLVGVRAGGYLRAALEEAVPEEKAAGTPLYLLLDDLAGSTLVSRWAASRWRADWVEATQAANAMRQKMEGVCIGFRPGSSALGSEGRPAPDPNSSRVEPLPNPADPAGWHDLPTLPGINFRRARRIEVWREGEDIIVESHFQDSGSAPDGGDRWAIHEYLLEARIDAEGLVAELRATPGTLPYAACRVAPINNEVLIGTPVRDLRDTVLEKLKFTGGCTHLNDMLRSLAEAPVLAAALPK